MEEYRSSSHTVYDIKYHFVWITKYRYKILRKNVAFRLRELLQQGCDARNIRENAKPKEESFSEKLQRYQKQVSEQNYSYTSNYRDRGAR